MTLRRHDRPNLSGIPSDYVPVTPNNDADNTGDNCIGLYLTQAGTVAFQTAASVAAAGDTPANATRTVGFPANTFVPGEITRVLDTGTAPKSDIFALQG